MTFCKRRNLCSLLWPFVALALFCLPALAQTQFSGQITSNTSTPATLANPVYYNETITAVGVSTTGALSCAAYPQVTFWFTRGGVQQVLGFVVTSAGSSWTAVPAVTTLQPGDLVTAQLSAIGVGCTNEIPLTVSFSTQYTANVSANLNNLASSASGTNAFVRFSLHPPDTYHWLN
jgi:hypothetical protein